MQYVDEDKVDIITNSIFNCLLKDTKKILKSSVKNPFWFFSENNDFVNLTEETPLLMTLKREKDYQQMIFFSEQATQISDKLFKRHLRQILSETIQIYYLPKLNETETETLSLYLNWFIKIKKLKLPDKSNFREFMFLKKLFTFYKIKRFFIYIYIRLLNCMLFFLLVLIVSLHVFFKDLTSFLPSNFTLYFNT